MKTSERRQALFMTTSTVAKAMAQLIASAQSAAAVFADDWSSVAQQKAAQRRLVGAIVKYNRAMAKVKL